MPMIFSLFLLFTYSSVISKNVAKQIEQCLLNEKSLETISSQDVNFGCLKYPDEAFLKVYKSLIDFSCKDELKELKNVAEKCIELVFSGKILSECEFYFHGLQEVKSQIDHYLKTLINFGDYYQDIIYHTDRYLKTYNELMLYLIRLRHTPISRILSSKSRSLPGNIVIEDLIFYDEKFIRLLNELRFKFKNDTVSFRKSKFQYKNLKYKFWVSAINQSKADKQKENCVVVVTDNDHKLSVYLPYKSYIKKVKLSLESLKGISNSYWESQNNSGKLLDLLASHFNILDMYKLFITIHENTICDFIKINEKEILIGKNKHYSKNMTYATFRDLKKFLKDIPQDFTTVNFVYSILKKLGLENELLSMALNDPIYKLILNEIQNCEDFLKNELITNQLLKYILYSQLQDVFIISNNINYKNNCSVELEKSICDLKRIISLTPDKHSEKIFSINDIFNLYLIQERRNVFEFMEEVCYDILTGIGNALDDEDTHMLMMDNIYCVIKEINQ